MSTPQPLALVPVVDEPSVNWPTDAMMRAGAALHAAGAVALDRIDTARADDRGQSTAEYALVILGAAAVAALLAAWAGQTNRISSLLDAILDRLIGQFR
jgi:hypothetical protein